MRSIVLGALLMAGCGTLLAPRHDPTSFFILAALPANGAVGSASSAARALSIGLGPVQLPDYLQRDEIITRTGPNRVVISETDRWAEPLGDSFRRVLGNDLSGRLDGADVVPYPWYSSVRLDY